MHGTLDTNSRLLLDRRSWLEFDRILRVCREDALQAGSLSDPLWFLLCAMNEAPDGLSFDTLDRKLAAHFGRSTLLRCLSMLEDRQLIAGSANSAAPLLSQVAITAAGRRVINQALDRAVAMVADPSGRNTVSADPA